MAAVSHPPFGEAETKHLAQLHPSHLGPAGCHACFVRIASGTLQCSRLGAFSEPNRHSFCDFMPIQCRVSVYYRCRASSSARRSDTCETHAQRQFACDLAGSLVIPNPIRVGLESPLAMPNTGEFVRMASVARLEVIWKGQDVLLETLADAKWGKRAWQLSLYGEGPDAEYLRDCARFFGLQDRVFFEGYERDVTKIWSRHHIKILPSRGEGMSLAMLKAMMCGRPVVATSVGGVAECI